MDKPTNAEKEFLDKLKLLTKSKEKWEVAIDDIAKGLSEKYSSAVTAKVLWLLGEMGLKYPLRVQEYIGKIANYLENNNPKLRERAVNAIGRIGRADKNLVLNYLDKLMKMAEDEADNVRLSFIWACENIAMNAPELFCENLKLFYELMQDKAERVRIEAPEMFRVMGKRKPKVVEPYLNKLQWFADNDQHPVVRIHSAGAIRITEKALQDCV
ncbi:sister chromatid cohesion protein PDS5 [Porphyromonas levii]|uniref:sister chromatid cohesion protein PDS5 n=1 Tax=Porphyromonas levii TaxID=28114 RepID=UPI001B8CD0F3|nr:sister chromatid cohesion protein PDS5 [Porphyromonas levii]MBR8770680.1 hypothetical protein [Porphyromonas levii]